MAAKIAYRVLTPSYVGKAVDCIAASFANDPFSHVSGLQPADWAAMSGMFVERAATKDISLVASKRSRDWNSILITMMQSTQRPTK